MNKLDDMVVNHIEDRLLDSAHLEKLLSSTLSHQKNLAERRPEHIALLQRQATESEHASRESMTPQRWALPIWTTRRSEHIAGFTLPCD